MLLSHHVGLPGKDKTSVIISFYNLQYFFFFYSLQPRENPALKEKKSMQVPCPPVPPWPCSQKALAAAVGWGWGTSAVGWGWGTAAAAPTAAGDMKPHQPLI